MYTMKNFKIPIKSPSTKF